jgi:hypothetical protein
MLPTMDEAEALSHRSWRRPASFMKFCKGTLHSGSYDRVFKYLKDSKFPIETYFHSPSMCGATETPATNFSGLE